MKRVRLMENSVEQKRRNSADPSSLFIFCEKSTGMTQFRAESNADRNSTVERIAGLLAMQCLVRGHDPDDFVVLIPAEENLVDRFRSRARELLEEGRAASKPASLSPRQSEILLSVIRNRANKEIASRLNITVRTVKFHISSLLNKFGVDNRIELARRAARLLSPEAMDTEGLAFRPASENTGPADLLPLALNRNSSPTAIKARSVRQLPA